MLVYFIPVIWLYILSNLKIKKYKNLIEKITVILLGIFLCTTYFNGTDWRAYELMYKYASFNEIGSFRAEKGFYLYMLLFKTLGFDFWHFFIITKLGCYCVILKKLREYLSNIFLGLLILYSYNLLYLFIDCPFRNLIAISIFLYSEKYLIEKKYLKYILLFCLAFTFHKSAIIMLLPLILKEVWRLNNYILMLILFLCFFILMNQGLLLKIANFFPFGVGEKLNNYIGTSFFNNSIFSLGVIQRVLVIFYIIFRKRFFLLKFEKKGEMILKFIIIYFIVYRSGLTIKNLWRLTYYFIVYYIVSICYLIESFNKKIDKKVLILLFSGYFIMTMYSTLSREYTRYIPYTSYLNYFFKEKPSYEVRSNYNALKYQEKFGKKFIEK